MKRMILNFVAFGALMSFIAMPAMAAEHHHASDHSSHASHAVAAADGENPLIEEMRQLDKTFQEIVSAVAVGNGERVHKALEAMHGKKEKTQHGLHTGHVTLKKNANKAKEFEKLDNEFHHQLEGLAEAAHKGDQSKMVTFTKKLMD
ncbi:MAG: hypothetical protein HYS21_09905 [Deltaproteobacteria bacterium]|nr:hypothetical protein [Deltaproteobacteria bacterium]